MTGLSILFNFFKKRSFLTIAILCLCIAISCGKTSKSVGIDETQNPNNQGVAIPDSTPGRSITQADLENPLYIACVEQATVEVENLISIINNLPTSSDITADISARRHQIEERVCLGDLQLLQQVKYT